MHDLLFMTISLIFSFIPRDRMVHIENLRRSYGVSELTGVCGRFLGASGTVLETEAAVRQS